MARRFAVAVLGPTASGKSDLGLVLAERLGGEILCCDSVQVYRGLDIGSGKATAAERARVPHHLLDLVDPTESFHAAAWSSAAERVIDDVTARGRVPVIVGGTGLYFRALVQGLFEAPAPDPAIRARHADEAAQVGVPALHARLAGVDPEAAAGIRPQDLVRTSRALEVWEQTGQPISVLWRAARAARAATLSVFTVLYDRPLDSLRARIDARVGAMMAAGFLDEVRDLRARGFGGARALGALGYKELGQHLDGDLPLTEAVNAIKRQTAAYARRQRTWFRKERIDLSLAADADVDAVVRAARAALTRAGSVPLAPHPKDG